MKAESDESNEGHFLYYFPYRWESPKSYQEKSVATHSGKNDGPRYDWIMMAFPGIIHMLCDMGGA